MFKVLKNSLLILLLIFFALQGSGQKEAKLIRQGNKLYGEGKYKEAEMDYRKALEINRESDKGKFNLGTAIYQEKNFNEAAKLFEDLSGKQLDRQTKAKVYHNYGNSLLESQQYEQSIAAYKNALINNPSDRDTKYNLEYARAMLKQQQQQQQNQQDKQDQQKEEQQNQEKEQEKKDQNKNQQDQNKKISKEDAERMLEAMKNDEKKTMSKLKKGQAKVHQVVVEKDW